MSEHNKDSATRRVSVPVGKAVEVVCDCGLSFTLFWNGGELDGHRCKCGRNWRLEHVAVDLVMEEP